MRVQKITLVVKLVKWIHSIDSQKTALKSDFCVISDSYVAILLTMDNSEICLQTW